MSRPGDALRAFAAQWCCPGTMERVIDPMIADLQREHLDALRAGRTWKSRWIRMQTAIAFLKVAALCAGRVAGDSMSWTPEDSRLLMRTMGFSLAGIVVVTATFATPSFLLDTPRPGLFVYVIPQLLALAIPIGIAIGIVSALAGAALSGRLKAGIVVLALAGSVASFSTSGWLAPLAVRAARDASGFPAQLKDFDGTDARSPAELTVGQLNERIDAATRFGLSRDVGYLRWLLQLYHARWAVPAATLTLTFCLLAMASFPGTGRLRLGITAFALVFAYELIGYTAQFLNQQSRMPVLLAAWLPNLVLALAGIAMMLLGGRPTAYFFRNIREHPEA